MKRDMDIIRRILLARMESNELQITSLESVEPAVFVAHAQWMEEAGLIKATFFPEGKITASQAFVFRLTWNGCEFADAVASDTLWKKAKDNVIKPGLSFTFDTLKDWLKTEIAQGFPTVRQIT